MKRVQLKSPVFVMHIIKGKVGDTSIDTEIEGEMVDRETEYKTVFHAQGVLLVNNLKNEGLYCMCNRGEEAILCLEYDVGQLHNNIQIYLPIELLTMILLKEHSWGGV